MSDPRSPADRALHAMFARTLAPRRLARALHGWGAAVLYLVPMMLVGCIIPPTLGVEQQDAGINSPPAITSVRSDQTELPEPGPVVFAVNQQSPLNLSLIDTDVSDTLYVRVFVDYSVMSPTAPRSTCTAPSSGHADRTATCDLRALCLAADVGQTRLMQVVVFDRQPLESGSPAFKAMPPGGLSTDRTYQLKCSSS